jgi:ATP-dependent exoDNAse (exonuclease V) alpha subunit
MKKYIKENQGPKLDIKKLQYDKNSQDITIMKGMPLICRINQKSIDIVNNEMFKVIKVMPNEIVVKNEMKEIIIPLAKINQLFHLGFCITIHKSQGETFDRPYSIYEWNTLNKTLKYVALSRSSDIKYINIV